MIKKLSIFLLAISILLAPATPALAADSAEVNAAREDTELYVYDTVKSPQVDSVGGEWAVLGLARSEFDVPEQYYNDYYTTVEKYVRDCGGVLHERKYTEYSRVILALTAAGFDPRNVAGYDLTIALGDFEKTIWQGINGPIFALIALDSGGYEIPKNSGAKTQATRGLYVNEILSRQLNNGGFSLAGGTTANSKTGAANADITAMALQALAKYQSRSDVANAIERALSCLAAIQLDDGGFDYGEYTSLESVAQVIVALTELGISINDPRFVKNGLTTVDNLMTFYTKGSGFEHSSDSSGSSQMSTEQALYALAAVWRADNRIPSLYSMIDAPKRSDQSGETGTGLGLKGKHTDVKSMPITTQGKTFSDISRHKNQPAIEALAARGIINGKSETVFSPDTTMTRAEFATIVTRGLGLTERSVSVFSDVAAGAWYNGYIGAAYTYGIINGTSPTTFNPNGTLNRAEAATMILRAAKLCGMDTELETVEIRDVLSQFGDYMAIPDWARSSVAFCIREGIVSTDAFNFSPAKSISRAEVSEMLFIMLGLAKLV